MAVWAQICDGNDMLNGDAGHDTFIWNANASGSTDGRDMVNGGTEGDTFVNQRQC